MPVELQAPRFTLSYLSPAIESFPPVPVAYPGDEVRSALRALIAQYGLDAVLGGIEDVEAIKLFQSPAAIPEGEDYRQQLKAAMQAHAAVRKATEHHVALSRDVVRANAGVYGFPEESPVGYSLEVEHEEF